MQSFWKNTKGFTLIELLVVIAIIGILSSIVLVAVGKASDKAKDARMMADMAQVRTIAALINAESASADYADLCNDASTLGKTGSTYKSQLDDLQTDIENQYTGAALTCYAAAKYCVQVKLRSGDEYCVDSNGKAGATSSAGCVSATSTCANL